MRKSAVLSALDSAWDLAESDTIFLSEISQKS